MSKVCSVSCWVELDHFITRRLLALTIVAVVKVTGPRHLPAVYLIYVSLFVKILKESKFLNYSPSNLPHPSETGNNYAVTEYLNKTSLHSCLVELDHLFLREKNNVAKVRKKVNNRNETDIENRNFGSKSK